MMTNIKEFPNPSAFDPERFLSVNGEGYALRIDVRNPEDIAFGFGRRHVHVVVKVEPSLISPTRICPGRHFANAWLWLTIATLLAVFEVSPELDENGDPILPDLEYECSLIR